MCATVRTLELIYVPDSRVFLFVCLVHIILLSVWLILLFYQFFVLYLGIFYCAFSERILLWYDIACLHDTYYFVRLVVWSCIICISHQSMLDHPLTNTAVYRYNNIHLYIMRLLLNYLHLHTFITYLTVKYIGTHVSSNIIAMDSIVPF